MAGLWWLVDTFLGTPPSWATIPERMMVIAGAIALILIVIRAFFDLMESLMKGGRD